ncbi:MAG: M64 family metallopeptidase [Bacteroidales bacterium]
MKLLNEIISKLAVAIIYLLPVTATPQNQVVFSDYFRDSTLRFDYFHAGNAESEHITPDQIYLQVPWAGNQKNCLQPVELGMYKASLYDSASNQLIFSKEYNSIFAEYKTTGPAIDGIQQTYHESVLIPYPKRSAMLVFEKRDRYNQLSEVYSTYIYPEKKHVYKENPGTNDCIVIPVVNNGNPHNCVDLAILAEGYRASELDSFKKDLNYFSNLLLSVEPYKSNALKFNVNGVFCPSAESGADEPQQDIYRDTRLNTSFNIFGTERYCLATDNNSVRDVAAAVPYDALLIMINHNRYGGGGIYNFQTVFTSKSNWRDYVFLHEFGHCFAGLADEYFSSSVAYQDIYAPGVEPLEPNITALPDPLNVKWKQFLDPELTVPTDWNKTRYDSLQLQFGRLEKERKMVMDSLRMAGTTESELEKMAYTYTKRLHDLYRERDGFFKNHPLKDKVGVYEGAGYLSKGMYRPTLNSLMHQFDADRLNYGPVNEHAIRKTIQYYTGE